MFGFEFKEPYRNKRYVYTDDEGFHYSTYIRRLDPVKELFFTGLGGLFTCGIIDAIWNLNIDMKYYWLVVLCAMIIRLYTMVKGGENHTE